METQTRSLQGPGTAYFRIAAGADARLRLRRFKELDYDISYCCGDPEESETKPPLGFVIVIEKLT